MLRVTVTLKTLLNWCFHFKNIDNVHEPLGEKFHFVMHWYTSSDKVTRLLVITNPGQH
jgi:hypothetical protein